MNGTNGHRSRRATHSGSWYSAHHSELDAQLDDWLAQARPDMPGAKAIIAPHAGYTYCGATAAWAYKNIDADEIDRIFILGPSHHHCLSGCALTACSRYKTPIGDLIVNQKVNADLMATGAFEVMEQSTDEAEHSIEMHLPYVAKVFERRRDQLTVTPVLVGSLSTSKHAMYGKIFSNYLQDPRTMFIVSSDFCHWGSRFHFAPHDKSSRMEIHEQIEQMDRQGMAAIESLEPHHFTEYLKRTSNTICGRHPISILLNALDNARQMGAYPHAKLRFTHYSQSTRVRSPGDSSVSYASAVLTV